MRDGATKAAAYILRIEFTMQNARARWSHGSLVAATVLVMIASASCTGSATRPPVANAEGTVADDDFNGGLREHHRHHHHGGVTLFIAMSLDTLGVGPEQRAMIEKEQNLLFERIEPARVAEQTLMNVLADDLTVGTVDRDKTDAALAQVSAAAAAVHTASADALNDLHAALSPTQRSALVDKMQAHWRVWRRANSDVNEPTSRERGYLDAVASDIDLTAEQVETIRAGLTHAPNSVPRLDAKETDAELDTFGEAFRQEAFDARSIPGTARVDAQIAAWGAGHTAHFVTTAMGVLSADQRARLAALLREHATHGETARVTR